MIGLLVVTHGELGENLIEVARAIVTKPAPMRAVSIDWNDEVPKAHERIESALAELDGGSGILILTDMLGGTPANLAMAFLSPGKIDVVTGVNLPMLIKFNNLPQEIGLEEAANLIARKGQSHITVAGEILARNPDDS